MSAPATAVPPANDAAPPAPRPEVRAKVHDLLTASPSFHQLPPDRQQQVARDTALIADALVGREVPGAASIASEAMASGDKQWESNLEAVNAIGEDPFTAGAAREGAAVAGEFMKQVQFVEFVSGLIDGVFNSIVTSNIQQMEAYSKMVSDVSKTLNQFRDDNTTSNDGKDNLLDTFPDVFDLGIDMMSGGAEPTLKLKDGVDQDAALAQVQQALGQHSDKPIESIDVSDPEVAQTLILASRQQIATSRQQLLATMVLMGLSRIVVTNGKIQAKIMYDFNASSQRTLSRTAQAMDFARQKGGNLVLTSELEGESETSSKYKGDYDSSYESGKGSYTGNYDSDYYTKGKYKYAQKPIMTATSMAGETQSDAFSAKASLMGAVEVNFKSDYLPLEKMATPEMMAAIQMRSKPIDHNKPQYAPGPAPAAGAPAPAAPAPAAPAPAKA
ncbi:hypothetical protein ACLBKU_17080 [Erythrobacter sp. NE805]|uniref:hypothetical protein n=1 Tax=Erythrobacter sp. NE805 TaxID=3389875 RepID=UPI00396B355C